MFVESCFIMIRKIQDLMKLPTFKRTSKIELPRKYRKFPTQYRHPLSIPTQTKHTNLSKHKFSQFDRQKLSGSLEILKTSFRHRKSLFSSAGKDFLPTSKSQILAREKIPSTHISLIFSRRKYPLDSNNIFFERRRIREFVPQDR